MPSPGPHVTTFWDRETFGRNVMHGDIKLQNLFQVAPRDLDADDGKRWQRSIESVRHNDDKRNARMICLDGSWTTSAASLGCIEPPSISDGWPVNTAMHRNAPQCIAMRIHNRPPESDFSWVAPWCFIGY